MERTLALAVLVVGLGFGPGASWGAEAVPTFVAGIDDVPLMPGLEEVEDSELVFDTPEGRIVGAMATGDATPEAIAAFYAAALPAFGWRQEAPHLFRRDGEDLTLEFAPDEAPAGRPRASVVKFSLRPTKPGSPPR